MGHRCGPDLCPVSISTPRSVTDVRYTFLQLLLLPGYVLVTAFCSVTAKGVGMGFWDVHQSIPGRKLALGVIWSIFLEIDPVLILTIV